MILILVYEGGKMVKKLSNVSAPVRKAISVVPRRVRSPLAGVWGFIVWLVGILVSLAVGFGMIGMTLRIPYIPDFVTLIAGWIVVVLALLGVLLKLIDVAGG